MVRKIRKILKLAAAAVVVVMLLAIAGVVALSFIDIDAYKQLVIQQVKSKTGRDLSIDKIKFDWGWTPVLVLEKVVFQNAESSSQKPMIAIEALRARMKLRALLSGDIEIESLSAVAPVIRLEVDREGFGNWIFTDRAASAQPAEQGDFGLLMLSRLKLLNLRIEDAQLHYINHKTGRVLDIAAPKLFAWTHWLDRRRGIDVEAVVNQRSLRITGTIDSLKALLFGSESNVNLDLYLGERTHLALKGNLGRLLVKPEVTLDVDIETESLTRTLGLVGIENHWPDGEMKLNMRLLSTPDNFKVSALSASMDTSYGVISINGEIQKLLSGMDGKIAVKLNAHSLERALTLIKLRLPLDVPAAGSGQVTAKAGLFSLSNLDMVAKNANILITATGSVYDLDSGHGINLDLNVTRLPISNFGKLVDAKVNIHGVISGTAVLVSDQKLFSLKDISAKVASIHANARVTGTANDLTYGTGIKLDVDLQTESLEEFAEYIGSDLLPLKQVDLKGRLENPDGIFGLYDINAISRSRDATITTKGDIKNLDTGEGLQLDLNIDATSLSRFPGLVGPELASVYGAKLTGILYKTNGIYGMREAQGEFALEQGVINLKGSMANLDERTGSNLLIDVDTDKLSRLSKWFDRELPKIGPVRLVTHLSDNNDRYITEGFKLTVGNSDLEGDIKIHAQKDRLPRFDLKLKSSLLDYATLFPKPEKKPKKQKTVFSKEPFNYNLLTQFNGEIELAIEEYRSHKLVLSEVNLVANVKESTLTIDPFSAKLAGGDLIGNISFQYDKNSSTLDLRVIGDQMLAGDIKYFRRNNLIKNGKTITATKLKGVGKSSHELVSSLNGDMLIVINDAQFDNTNLELAGTDLLTAFIRKLNPFVKKSKVVEMECGVLHFQFKDGVARANKGIALQTKKVDVVGDGDINLASENVKIAFFTKPREGIGISAGNLAPVVRLGGTLADPKAEANAAGFLKGGANVGAAWFTSGLWLLAKGLLDRAISTGPVCRRAILGPPPPVRLADPIPEELGDF